MKMYSQVNTPLFLLQKKKRALTAGLGAAEKWQISFLCWVSNPDFCAVQHVAEQYPDYIVGCSYRGNGFKVLCLRTCTSEKIWWRKHSGRVVLKLIYEKRDRIRTGSE